LRTLAWVVGGAGVAGLAAGAILGGVALSENKNAEKQCLGTVCPSQGFSSSQSASHAATGSTIAFAAGGVLAAAGVVLFWVAPSDAHSSAAWLELAPMLEARAAGARLQGAW
jgi:hypothetical protein